MLRQICLDLSKSHTARTEFFGGGVKDLFHVRPKLAQKWMKRTRKRQICKNLVDVSPQDLRLLLHFLIN